MGRENLNLFVDSGKLQSNSCRRTTKGTQPVFSWGPNTFHNDTQTQVAGRPTCVFREQERVRKYNPVKTV